MSLLVKFKKRSQNTVIYKVLSDEQAVRLMREASRAGIKSRVIAEEMKTLQQRIEEIER